jgi:hypothetical protein
MSIFIVAGKSEWTPQDFNFKKAAFCPKRLCLPAHIITKIAVHVPLRITRFYEISDFKSWAFCKSHGIRKASIISFFSLSFQTVQQLGHNNICGHTTKLNTPMYFY